MKILVTGGTGFIGKPLLDSLIENVKEVQILNLTKSSSNSILKNIEFFNCDLSVPETYYNKVNDFKPQIVIHLAWEGIPNFSLDLCSKNILSSIKLIEVVSKLDSCKKIIITGSCFEYNNKIGVCVETDFVTPKDYFTFAKKTILSFLELECTKNNKVYIWARLFYVYGPNQRKGSLIPTLINTLKSGKCPELNTPKNANDFIHVNDVANAIMNMSINNIESGIYNLGSGVTTTVSDVSKIVEMSLFGKDAFTNELIEKTKSTEKTVDFNADITKSIESLNWTPKIGIIEGIKSLINK